MEPPTKTKPNSAIALVSFVSTMNGQTASTSPHPNWLNEIDIDKVIAKSRASSDVGEVNGFIPALSRVERSKFGISIRDASGPLVSIGDYAEPFSIQSISKLFCLMILMEKSADELWQRIGARASVIERFDSVAPLEFSQGIPTNPFLNCGALVMVDMLMDLGGEPEDRVARLLDQSIGVKLRVNEEVAQSEIETAHRNRALAYYLKSFGNLRHDVEQVVGLYCRMCAIELSADELAAFGAEVDGKAPLSPEYDHSKLLSVMRDCGLYGESLEIGRRYAIPAKSGSGGGILAFLPPGLGLGIWSPPLGTSGNSVAGTSILTQIGRLLIAR
jgi:glutaminase